MQKDFEGAEVIKGAQSNEGFEAKRELLFNAIGWFVQDRIAEKVIDRLFVFDAFRLLGHEVPHQQEIIRELNSLQSDEGTWKKGHEHYVPTTAQALFFYKRIGKTPEKSLEPFLSSIDTWEKVVEHNNRYQPDNFWGGLWGYIGCYTAFGQHPPWTDTFLEKANSRFDEWASDNHQRSHLIDCFRQLHKSIPRREELIALTLQDQLPDGHWTAEHWNPALPQTTFAIATLKILDREGAPETDEAIARGLSFIDRCFKIVRWHGKEYGGYAQEPDAPYPDPLATSLAVIAHMHPEQLEELTGYGE